MKSPRNRVVITGMGVLAPNGNSVETFWHNTLHAVSGIAGITRFPIDDFPVKIAGEVKNFKLERFLPPSVKVKPKRMGLHTQFGIAASYMAIRHAGLTLPALRELDQIRVYLGVSTNAMDVIEKNNHVMATKGFAKVSSYGVSSCQPHAVANEIVQSLDIRTSRNTFSSACPAGLESVAQGRNAISRGESNLILCGGVDSPITQLSLASMHLAGLAPDFPNLPPEKCSRPFDAERTGGIIGEGAGMFIMESLQSALSRGAHPYAEVLGYGNYADDVNTPPGSGLRYSMQSALDDASLLPGEIDYINAHGPSHPIIDAVETSCIKAVFGTHSYRIPVSSIKGVIGNPLAAAGPLQMAASILAIRDELLPPTANYKSPDPDCDLNYLPNHFQKRKVHRVMINLHGLGGGNSSLILKRVNTH